MPTRDPQGPLGVRIPALRTARGHRSRSFDLSGLTRPNHGFTDAGGRADGNGHVQDVRDARTISPPRSSLPSADPRLTVVPIDDSAFGEGRCSVLVRRYHGQLTMWCGQEPARPGEPLTERVCRFFGVPLVNAPPARIRGPRHVRRDIIRLQSEHTKTFRDNLWNDLMVAWGWGKIPNVALLASWTMYDIALVLYLLVQLRAQGFPGSDLDNLHKPLSLHHSYVAKIFAANAAEHEGNALNFTRSVVELP